MNLTKRTVVLLGLLLACAVPTQVPAQTVKDDGTTLKQIIIYGRHSIRAPLKYPSQLAAFAVDSYPSFDVSPGGALVFELRQSRETKKYLVRVFYTSRTLDQLRNLTPMTHDDSKYPPPATMQLLVPGGSNSSANLDREVDFGINFQEDKAMKRITALVLLPCQISNMRQTASEYRSSPLGIILTCLWNRS